MGVTYNGLDCLADKKDPMYQEYHTLSQEQVPWLDQPWYGNVTIYFGVATIFVAMVKSFWYMWRDYRYISSGRKMPSILSSFANVVTAYCRLFGYQQVPEIFVRYLSLPSSLGSVIYSFIASGYLLCFCFIPHFWYRGCRGFGSPPLAVRAGIMGTALTPFILILAGKVNAITILTGISYEKLNWIHQFVGVAALVLGLVHTIPFIYQPLQEGGVENLAKVNKDYLYVTGWPPTIFLILLCALFKKQVREKMYELSFHLHWLLGLGYVASLGVHVYDQLDQQKWIWATAAFWGAQWICRIVVKTFCKPGSGFLKFKEADIRKLDGNTFEVSIDRIDGFSWRPGQHCFLRFVGKRIVDSHPFSIATIKEEEKLRFIIVPKAGLTRKLHDELDHAVAIKKKVILDGPYGGTTRNHHAFDSVLLMATGSGVTVTLPYLLSLVKESKLVVQRIDFRWIIRRESDIGWIRDELNEAMAQAGSKLNINIYVAGESGSDAGSIQKDSWSSKEKEVTQTSEEESVPSGFNTHYGRPNVHNIMADYSQTMLRRNLVVSSGSDLMKRTVSQTVAGYQTAIVSSDKNQPFIEEICLHTESFGW